MHKNHLFNQRNNRLFVQLLNFFKQQKKICKKLKKIEINICLLYLTQIVIK